MADIAVLLAARNTQTALETALDACLSESMEGKTQVSIGSGETSLAFGMQMPIAQRIEVIRRALQIKDSTTYGTYAPPVTQTTATYRFS